MTAGAYYYVAGRNDDDDQAAETVIKPTRGSIEQVVTAQGKLEPKEYVDVGAQVSGQLKKLAVDIGDTVKKGELIAEIDDRIYQSRVEADMAGLKTLQAQLAEQEAQIKYAGQQYTRNERLLQSKAVSKQVLESAQTDLQMAQARAASLKAQIEQSQSNLKADQANLGFTKIYAPIDGTVVSQTAREGQTLNANQSAPVIVQVADLDTMTVRAQVAEADVLNLKEGMPVYFTILGNQTRKWQGKTRQILPSPEVINEVVLYNVLVDVDNKDRQLMTGMTTQMSFVMGNAENVLLLPMATFVKPLPDQNNDMGEAHLVRVRQGEKTLDKTVHIGLSSRNQAEIRDGITETDQVVIPAEAAPKTPGAGGPRGFGPRL